MRVGMWLAGFLDHRARDLRHLVILVLLLHAVGGPLDALLAVAHERHLREDHAVGREVVPADGGIVREHLAPVHET